MLTKRPSFSRVYVFVVPSVPSLPKSIMIIIIIIINPDHHYYYHYHRYLTSVQQPAKDRVHHPEACVREESARHRAQPLHQRPQLGVGGHQQVLPIVDILHQYNYIIVAFRPSSLWLKPFAVSCNL